MAKAKTTAKETTLEDKNAELELELASLEGKKLKETNATQSLHKETVLVDGVEYVFKLASFNLNGVKIASTCASDKVIKALLAIKGQCILVAK